MKNIPKLVLVLFILSSCEKEEKLRKNELNSKNLTHVELGFMLDKPEIILNELATGKLNRAIRTILQQSFNRNIANPVEHFWEFEYLASSSQVIQMTYYQPHYSGCEKTVYNFEYNSDRYVSSVISTRTELSENYFFDYDGEYLVSYTDRVQPETQVYTLFSINE